MTSTPSRHPTFLILVALLLQLLPAVPLKAGLPEGWRFTSTLPQGNTFHGAWAAGPDDLFIGGEGGVILRWNGQKWMTMPTPTQKTIFAMHGLSATDVWAVGGDPYGEQPGDMSLMLHFDGTSWTEMAPPNFLGQTYSMRAVHAIAHNDVWAIPEIGTTPVHYNGVKWEFVNLPSSVSMLLEGGFKGVGAVSANNVFFFGSHGQIVHKAGSQWTLEQKIESGSFSVNLLQAIWAPALDQVYVGGNWGQVYRRNANGTWTDLGLGGGISPSYNVQHIWGRSPTEIYLLSGDLIRRFDGQNSPQVTFFTERKRGYWTGGAHHADGLFCFGGTAVHEFRPDGAAGILSALTVNSHKVPYSFLDGVTSYAGSRLLVWGDTTSSPGAYPLLTLSDGIFHPFEPLPPGMSRQTRISTVSAAGPNDLIVCWDNWAKPGSGVHRWNGTAWSRMEGYFDFEAGVFEYPPDFAIGIWRAPSGTLFAIESHRVFRTDAQGRWRQIAQIPLDPTPNHAYTAVWGRSDSEVHVSTDNGRILTFNGSTFSEQALPGGGRINALGGDAQHAYAAGSDGRLWYRDGAVWKSMSGVMQRSGDDFTAIASGTQGVFAFQMTPSQYTGGGLGRLWKLQGTTATRVMQGISGGNDTLLASSSSGHLHLVAGANYILTDQPAPAGFTQQRVDRSATEWVVLGDSGAAIRVSAPTLGYCLVAAWRVEQASSGLPADLVGTGTPAGQHWVIRSEEWQNQGRALPPVHLRFDYDPALVSPGTVTGSAELYRYDGVSWNAVGATLMPPASIFSTGPSPLSEWTFAFRAGSVESPELEVEFVSPTTVQIRWPASSPLALRSAANLVAPIIWTPVAETPTVVGEQKQVRLPVDGEARFFRLGN